MEQSNETLLARIVTANQPESRYAWARAYKESGRKVIGVAGSYVPEELIWAAGMLPMRITGVWDADISLATVYRSTSTCAYCNHVLQAFLSGELDFLDGAVIVDKDQDVLRMIEIAEYDGKVPSTCILHTPFSVGATSEEYFQLQLTKLKGYLEELSGEALSDEAIGDAIALYNRIRALVTRIYELQKRPHPALTGTELMGLTTGIQVMDRVEAADILEKLIPWLEERKAPLAQTSPRIMVSSDSLDNPAFIALIEEQAAVVMDDLDTGSRYFMTPVNEHMPAWTALAKRYVTDVLAPRMDNWTEQIDSITAFARDWNVDGVIVMPLTWCNPQRFRWPLVKAALESQGTPAILLEREYRYTNEGQLRTRVGAFTELL